MVDASHPSQIGGLLASMLLIASVGQFCISKSVVGFRLLARAQNLSSSETALVQMSEMPTTSSTDDPDNGIVP